MKSDARRRVVWAAVLASLISLVWGLVAWSPLLFALGIIGLGTVLYLQRGRQWLAARRDAGSRPHAKGSQSQSQSQAANRFVTSPAEIQPASDVDSLVETMLARRGRFSLLLRPQIVGNLTESQLAAAVDLLEESMSLVPEGRVHLIGTEAQIHCDSDETLDAVNGSKGIEEGRVVAVAPLFLDRYPVTNEQYQHFIDDGGYEQLAIWEQEALPAMLDFVDQTGHPAPRFWKEGRYEPGKDDLPVVGVSWFEAAAFARWCGKRLPTDAEWTKAAAWPVASSPGQLIQRRYPWGDDFDAKRANIWGSGPDRVVSVFGFSTGASVGGAHQLIGNVWEWTGSNYGSPGDVTLRLPTAMKTLRGGGFDTYFAIQASCHFQSGDSPLARRHNVGFRLAIGACDVAVSGLANEPCEASPEHLEAVT